MDAEAHAQLERIKRYSRGLQRLFVALSVIFTIAAGATLLVILLSDSPGVTRLVDLDGVVTIEWNTASLPVRVLAFCYLIAVYTIGISIVYRLARLFGLYAEGHIFTAANVRQIRQVGILLMVFAVTRIFVVPITALIDTTIVSVSPSALTETTGIGMPESPLTPLFFGLIVVFVSWVMDVGRRLREENDLVV